MTQNSYSSQEKIGFFPRSILRTFGRFRRQLWPGIENLVLQEFRISRSQFLVACQSLFLLLLFPLVFHAVAKNFLFRPTVEYLWNTKQSDIFLNATQEERAFHQMTNFEEKLYFESLILPPPLQSEDTPAKSVNEQNLYFQNQFQDKLGKLAIQYNEESIDSLTNLITDLVTAISFYGLCLFMKPQLIILKSFLTEFLYSFGDTTKSFLLLFVTDLFVGFHSPHGWEVFLETLMNRFGLPENEDFIFLFVATFPVLLDTIIKYWIFRYLNKISPSTVATYHTMIE